MKVRSSVSLLLSLQNGCALPSIVTVSAFRDFYYFFHKTSLKYINKHFYSSPITAHCCSCIHQIFCAADLPLLDINDAIRLLVHKDQVAVVQVGVIL